MPSVYSVPIYHRCIDGTSSVSYAEGNIPQGFKRNGSRLIHRPVESPHKVCYLMTKRSDIYFTAIHHGGISLSSDIIL